jgi:xanthine dehydrogenase accessory factor
LIDDWLSMLREALEAGETIASATVVSTKGSTPREAGAKMLVRKSGAIEGTVGGGCGEAEVWRASLQALETGEPRVVFVDLTGEISMDSAAVCGGTMDILVEAWQGRGSAEVSRDADIARVLSDRLASRRPSVLASVVSAQSGGPWRAGDHIVVGPEGVISGPEVSGEVRDWLMSQAMTALTRGTYTIAEYGSASHPTAHARALLGLDPLKQPPFLAVMGAGHIAVPLAHIGKMLGFSVAVLDDRASFANRERFPDADVVRAADFAAGIRTLPIDADSYVVLITRGHQHDVECLEAVIDTDAAYIGMIGSRRRVQAVFDLLAERGVESDKLRRVHAPIGLDIGAKTPAEIAVSIAAELVNVRRGCRSASMVGSSCRAESSVTPPVR